MTRSAFTPRSRLVFSALYVACALVFFAGVAGFYRPGLGFTSMLRFGRDFESRVIPELRDAPRFVVDGKGYDGQFYAQLAAKPVPWAPDVRRALDNAPYRAGRIVVSLFAYALAGGNPVRAMHVFAIMNVAIWCGLAWLLLRWFPPGTTWDLVCWVGLLFSAGTMMCVCRALPDLSAFLLMVAGLRLWESARPNAAAGMLALAGLVRETSILAAAVVVQKPEDRRSALTTLGRVLFVTVPTLLLLVVLRAVVTGTSHAASENFGVPFVGMMKRFAQIADDGFVASAGVVVTMLSIVVQAAFFVFRPRPADARYRLGAVYALLFAITNDAIWGGYPGSAPRVLLPLLFAFNLSVPRSPRLWPLLLVGNLSVVTGWHNLMHPPKAAATVAPRAATPELSRATSGNSPGAHSRARRMGQMWGGAARSFDSSAARAGGRACNLLQSTVGSSRHKPTLGGRDHVRYPSTEGDDRRRGAFAGLERGARRACDRFRTERPRDAPARAGSR